MCREGHNVPFALLDDRNNNAKIIHIRKSRDSFWNMVVQKSFLQQNIIITQKIGHFEEEFPDLDHSFICL